MSRYFVLFLWAMALLLSLFGSPLDGYCLAFGPAAAIAIGAGASLIGGLASDYINSKSQADTNEANKQIAAENRAWQSNENELARQWSERQWNLNNQYNTPSAIAQRQREAGFNPYLLGSQLGNGSSQPAQANTSSAAPDSPQMVAPKVGSTANAINNTSSQIANYALYKEGVDAQAANQQAQSDEAAVRVANGMRKVYGDTKIDGKNADEWYLERHFATKGDTSGNVDYRQSLTNLRKSQADAELSEIEAGLEREFGKKRAQSALAKVDQDITESAARIGKMASDAKLNEAQIKTEAQKFWTEVAKQYNLKKQGEFYVCQSEQLSLLKDMVANRMRIQNEMLSRRNSEDFATWRSRGLVRDWLKSDEGRMNTFQNFEIGTDIYLNQADKVIKTISPIIPSMNFISGSYDYHRFYGE